MAENSRKSNLKWRATPDATKFMILDDNALAYHRPSGATHLLNIPAVEILRSLEARHADIDFIMSDLKFDRSGNGQELSRNEILLTLERLEELGLIQRA